MDSIARHFLRRIEKNIIEIVNKNEDIVEVLDDFKPELIVHLGAELKDESKMFESNVLLTMKILEWVRVNSKTKLILLELRVNMDTRTSPRNESDCPLPDTIYEGTKAADGYVSSGLVKDI
jgi:nucleoside-diphosphate-sugar epimerase